MKMKFKLLFILLLFRLVSSSQTISLVQPNGGQIFAGAKIQNITWSSSNISNIKIELSIDSGSTWAIVAANVAASAFSYSWLVPSTGSTKCLIKLSDLASTASAISANVFTILPPSINLIFPNGGESYKKDQGTFIKWSSTSVSSVKIEYSTNNGSTWIPIAIGVNTFHQHINWTIPGVNSTQCLIRVISESGTIVGDTSNAAFTISGNYPSPDPSKYYGGSFDGYSSKNNLPDSIYVVQPNTAINLYAFNTYDIKWWHNNIENVKIEYSTNNGANWNLVAASVPSSQLSYKWLVPSGNSNQCRIRISDAQGALYDINDTPFTIIPPSITLIYPNGNEQFRPNQGQLIRWNSVSVQTVRIEFSSNNGSSWSSLATGVKANQSSINWTLPNITGPNNRIRIIDESNATIKDSSDLTFAILAPYPAPDPTKYYGGSFDGYAMKSNQLDSLYLISPNGSEQLEGGINYPITWFYRNLENLKIEFSKDSGATWSIITSNVSASQLTYNWTVPFIGSTRCLIKISDAFGTLTDLSNNTFTILPPSISLINPNGGEQFKVNEGTFIGWNSISVSKVKVEYSINNGNTWNLIANYYPAKSKSINWTIPNLISSQFRVRVVSTDSAGVFGVSNSQFAVTGNFPTIDQTKFRGGSYDGYDNNSYINAGTLPPIPISIIAPDTICANSIQTFRVNKQTNTTYYLWQKPNSWQFLSNQGDTFITVFTDTISGNMGVIAFNNFGNSGILAKSFYIKKRPPNKPTILIGDSTPCIHSLTSYKINRVASAITYTWSFPFGWIVNGSNNDTIVNVIPNRNSGFISVYANDNCTSGDPLNFYARVDSTPVNPIAISGNTNPCKASSQFYSVSKIKNANSYNWNVPAGWNIISGFNDSILNVTVGQSNGNITVNTSNKCGTSNLTTLPVNYDSIPIQPSQIFGPTVNCVGSSQTYTVNRISNVTTYTWNVPVGWNITSAQNDTFILVTVGSISGNISVSANNSCGNSLPRTLAVSTITIPLQPSLISGNSAPCLGSSNLFAINKVNTALSYNWTFPSGWSITTAQGDTNITLSTGPSNGNIMVTASNSCGTSPGRTLAATVQVVPAPPATIIGSTQVCKQTSNTFKINRISNASNYIWTIPTGWIINSGGIDTFITATTNSNSGNITVRSNNICGSSLPISLFILTDSIPPQPALISGNTTVCGGSPQIYSTLKGANSTNYTWSLPNGWTINSGQGDTLLNTTAGVNSGNVIVQASNLCGSSAQRTLGITVSGTLPPQALPITGNNFPCLASTQVYTIPKIPLALSYTWSVPNGWTINAGQNDTFINVTVGSNAGNIQVTATNYCGTNIPRILSVNVNTIPSAPTSITGSNDVCKQGTSLFRINRVSGASTYSWSLPSGWSFLATQGDTFMNYSIGANASTIFVSAGNICGNSSQISKTTTLDSIPPIPSPIVGNINPCLGSIESFSITNIPNATNYNWSLPSGWLLNSGNGTTTISSTVGTANGNIQVTASNFCGTSATRTLGSMVKFIPTAPTSIIGNNAVCKQGNASFRINRNSAATSYTWTVPSSWAISNGNGDTIINTIVGNVGGLISVYSSNVCGNSSATNLNVAIDSIPTQAAIISGNINPCLTSSQTYSITPIANASSYNWIVPSGWVINNGQLSTNLQVTVGPNSGNIQVAAINFCGTGAYKSLATSIETIPAAPTSVIGNNVVCKSSTQTYVTNRISNASSYIWTLPNGWNISTGLNDTFITVNVGSTSGNVSVRATNFCGTSSNKSLFVSVDSIPPQPNSISGISNPCNGSSTTYSLINIPNATSYIWNLPSSWSFNGNQNGSSINVNVGNTDGLISVSGSNACGTGNSRTISVYVKNIPIQPNNLSGSLKVCKGSFKSYFINSVNAASSYNWVIPQGWIINSGQGDTILNVTIGSLSGNISVSASNNCGIGPIKTLFVSVDSIPPTPGLITGNNDICSNNDYTYYISKIANAKNYTWAFPLGWTINTGQGDTLISSRTAYNSGNISVNAGNDCGVSSNRILAIIADTSPKIAANIAGLDKPCFNSNSGYSIPLISNATNYNWVLPPDWTISSGQGSNNLIIKPGTIAGSIEVVAINKCGISNKISKMVEVEFIPAKPSAISGNAIPCSNSTYSYFIPKISNATNYLWGLPQGWTILNSMDTSVLLRTSLSSGEISVVASNVCGSGNSRTLNTVIQPIPNKPIIQNPIDTLCSGYSYSLFTDSVQYASGYNWSMPNGWTINSGQGTRFANFTSSESQGFIKVVANNGVCISDTTYKNTLVTKTPNVPINLQGNLIPCFNTIETYSTNLDLQSDSYKWIFPSGWSIDGSSDSNTIIVNTGNTSGIISVQAQKLGCLSNSKQANVLVQFIPVIPISIQGDAYVRSNETKAYSIPLIYNATNYNWIIPKDWAFLSGVGTNNILLLTGDSSGHIVVSASNVCGTSANSSKSVFSGIPNYLIDNSKDALIKVYPIPADDYLNITTSNNLIGITDWVIYDLLGKKVLTGKINHINSGQPIPIEISNLTPSNYLLELDTQNSRIYRKFNIVR